MDVHIEIIVKFRNFIDSTFSLLAAIVLPFAISPDHGQLAHPCNPAHPIIFCTVYYSESEFLITSPINANRYCLDGCVHFKNLVGLGYSSNSTSTQYPVFPLHVPSLFVFRCSATVSVDTSSVGLAVIFVM